jgi:hypothetical protein
LRHALLIVSLALNSACTASGQSETQAHGGEAGADTGGANGGGKGPGGTGAGGADDVTLPECEPALLEHPPLGACLALDGEPVDEKTGELGGEVVLVGAEVAIPEFCLDGREQYFDPDALWLELALADERRLTLGISLPTLLDRELRAREGDELSVEWSGEVSRQANVGEGVNQAWLRVRKSDGELFAFLGEGAELDEISLPDGLEAESGSAVCITQAACGTLEHHELVVSYGPFTKRYTYGHAGSIGTRWLVHGGYAQPTAGSECAGFVRLGLKLR